LRWLNVMRERYSSLDGLRLRRPRGGGGGRQRRPPGSLRAGRGGGRGRRLALALRRSAAGGGAAICPTARSLCRSGTHPCPAERKWACSRAGRHPWAARQKTRSTRPQRAQRKQRTSNRWTFGMVAGKGPKESGPREGGQATENVYTVSLLSGAPGPGSTNWLVGPPPPDSCSAGRTRSAGRRWPGRRALASPWPSPRRARCRLPPPPEKE